MDIKTRHARTLALAFAAIGLGACQQGEGGLTALTGQTQSPPAQELAVARPLSPTVAGEKVGNGPQRLALLVPQGAGGGAGLVGKQMSNAAKLAMRDFGSGRLQLVIKDTKGQAAEAARLAGEARDEGASLLLGPLLSGNVATASAVAIPARLPMIGFSSDLNRARPGSWLLSFAPQDDTVRTLNYGASLGATSIVALLPDSAYGALVERTLRDLAPKSGITILGIARYGPSETSRAEAVRMAAALLPQASGIYIPEGGETPLKLLSALKAQGADLSGKQIMGSGQWESVPKDAAELQGAIFATADKSRFGEFARRYRATYGEAPLTNAGLAYDAVSMAAQLADRKEGPPFAPDALQSPAGFSGVTGLFRLLPNGRVERGLAVAKIEGGGTRIVSPAPQRFSGAG